MTHQFQPGEQAIVLPTKWDYYTRIMDGKGHFLKVFSMCTIIDVSLPVLCKGITPWGIDNQLLMPHQLIPFHIPEQVRTIHYSRLDEE